jgi:hypothetical protein
MKIISLKIAFLLVNGLFILLINSYSQSNVNKENFFEAESYFIHEEYNDALPIYIQLKETYPANYNLDYRIGRCYLVIPYEKLKAITYLEKAAKHISAEYKEGKFNEYRAPQDVLFYLGDAYRINNLLEKAIATYKLFKSKVNPALYDVGLVDNEIENCIRAMDAEKKPIDFDAFNLGNIINTKNSETHPVVSPNEDVMVYTSKLPFYEALFFSRKVDEKWTTPVNMMSQLGIDGDCFPTCISYDGNELYLYRSNDYLGDLYVTNYKNGKWTKIRKLNSNINTKYWESHASISRDGKTLYFTSNREGGFGGLDIYKSERTKGDDWGPAVNLGPVINSKYNEETPFIMPDGKRIYFSSFGHETIGGYDIFYSDLNSKGTWLKPQNLGFPINTTDDDLFYCPVRDGSIAYMASYDPNGYGRYDIVRLNVYTYDNPRKYHISGIAKLQKSSDPIPEFYLVLFDKEKHDTILRRRISGEKISFDATAGKYDVYIYSNQNQSQKQPLTITWGAKNTNLVMNFELTPQIPGGFGGASLFSGIDSPNLKNVTTSHMPLNLYSVFDLKNTKDSMSVDSSDKVNKANSDSIENEAETRSLTFSPDIIDSSTLSKYNSGGNSIVYVAKQWLARNIGITAFICFLPLLVIIWFLMKRRKKGEKKEIN